VGAPAQVDEVGRVLIGADKAAGRGRHGVVGRALDDLQLERVRGEEHLRMTAPYLKRMNFLGLGSSVGTGGAAINAFANLQFDFALIGATGLNSEGCWTTEFTESEVKKNIITRAKRRIVLADQSKWQAPGTVLFSAWESISDWVVDQLPKDAAQAIPKSVCVHHPIRSERRN
jgi:hypothetical protein